MFDEMNAQMAALPQAVQLWVNWMTLVFATSLLFVWRHKEARRALLAFLATFGLALAIFSVSPNVHLFAVAHLIFWTPLLAYLIRRWRRSGDLKYRKWSAYRIWVSLLIGTVAISLAFDVRDVILVALGRK
jgi:hypothetical protein